MPESTRVPSSRRKQRADTHKGCSTYGRFIVLEGLSAVGKSTVSPLLAELLNASFIPTLLPEFESVRKGVDKTRLVMPRLHFWMMTNYAVAETVRKCIHSGQDVVVESYFYRTLATHAALGASQLPEINWDHALAPDMTILLTVDEPVRQQRLAERGQETGLSYWSRLEESNVEQTRRTYESFNLTPFDTNGLDAAEVADKLAHLGSNREAIRG
ncbi:dTMP kinase [Streptomyces sp. NPDC001939]